MWAAFAEVKELRIVSRDVTRYTVVTQSKSQIMDRGRLEVLAV
jgi:hypothetical protein